MILTLLLTPVLSYLIIRFAIGGYQCFLSTRTNRKSLPRRALHRLATINEPGAALADLIETEGAGSWPPQATHDDWPAALRPYREVWNAMVTLLPTAEPCLDEKISRHKVDQFRSLMCQQLQDRVDLGQVQQTLQQVADGDHPRFPRAAFNGFYGCIALSRHAYRWTSIPIIRAAQSDTTIDFPAELSLPWSYLQKSFGTTADSGNNTSNVLCNYDINNQRAFKFTKGLSEEITSSEENFFRIFLDLEISALPIYHEMVYAISAFEQRNNKSCVVHLQNISSGLRNLLKSYYRNMRNSKVGQKVWMRWIQGFQGWAAGRMIDGEFVRFNGISASQVLFFQAIDAFLGMHPFLSDIDNERYIPIKQRQFVSALRKHSFRNQIDAKTDTSTKVAAEFTKIVNQVKSFRAAHRTRCLPYLREPAPERMPMTAGMFQPRNDGAVDYSTRGSEDAFAPLMNLLTSRLQATK